MDLKVWISAARLRTLPLALSSIFFGTAAAIYHGFFTWQIFTLAVSTTICLQVLSNYANDYGDAISGKDNEERIGPSRAVSSGEISKKAMLKAVVLFSFLSLLSGLALLFSAFRENGVYFLIFLLIGIAAIAAAISYTMGEKPYGYNGLGDFFVFLFFGLVGVIGSFFLFSKSLEITVILPAVSAGLLSVAVLNFNNMRDIENDASTGKRTFAVRIGLQGAKQYQYLLVVFAFFSLIAFALFEKFLLQQYLFLLLMPLFAQMIKSMIKINKPAEFDPFLKKTALGTFGLSILFLLSVLIG
ncbi:1,4-dihydroxy-2-naphthoate polyprenyltransferase [Chitinophagales bacterium]|nr:1,4-dihydroxy-2-naphthoate polyprenyltransferase [Chitinophagales bacterium]